MLAGGVRPASPHLRSNVGAADVKPDSGSTMSMMTMRPPTRLSARCVRWPALRRLRVGGAAIVACWIGLAAPLQAAEPSDAACTDFDAHVNGAWMQTAVLPPDRARIGSFDMLRMANDRLLETA